MKGIKITGIGWVTVSGMGSGREHKHFAMPPGQLPDIDPSAIFKKPYPNFRRMDAYSLLGLTAIALALIDAGLDEWTVERNIGLIASTVYGCLGTDVDYYITVIPDGGANASPALFSYTLANSYLGEAAIRFGLTGTNYVITEQEPSGLAVLQTALDHIRRRDVEKILCGVSDVGCPEIFGRSSQVPPGAVFLMLEKSFSRNISPYGGLAMKSDGGILKDDVQIGDVTDLVQQCLSNGR